MARKRSTNGSGSIRKRSDGRWEAIYTVGRDPGTGKPIRKSIYAQTAEECAKKLREATAAIDAGKYTDPNKMKLAEWLDVWLAEYCGSIKPGTLKSYTANVENHIKPAMGALRLCEIQPHTCQGFINKLQTNKGLSPKTIKNIHGVLCKALSEAAKIKYITENPASGCVLPRVIREEIKPLEGQQISAFMKAISGTPSEDVFFIAINTGMRLSEVLGLRWKCINFPNGTIKVDSQMLFKYSKNDQRKLATTKNSKPRTFKVAPGVLNKLKNIQRQQREQRIKAAVWNNDLDLVFTDENGNELSHTTIEHRFKRIVSALGLPDRRFHDLRHTFATEAIRCGIDLKTLSNMLGHYSVAFTMDTYGHTTDMMQEDAASRIQSLIESREPNSKT